MKKRLKQMITCALAIPLLATALFPGFAAASSKTVHKQPMVAEGELIVRYKKPHGNKLKSLAQSSAYQTQGVDSRTVLVKTDRAKLELATRNLAADPDVEYVEPNYVYHSSEQQSAPVDDPLYDQLWGLEAVGAPEAWELLRGWSGEKKAEVVVAVVDTGVDANHPDLAGKVLPYGYNTIANNTNAQDDYGHGTHVAGTIAAVTDNGTGVAGIAGKENIRILPIKVLDDTGYGTA
ncbi:MAG: S8 family serine peptidase, partial [Clostridia bacterium]